ncbi:MAG TPA: LPP20 family lipoprotein [Bacteroidota bacterium]|nr:LPP20 family lipoprotein [Bacteroidota bacterium]
MRQIQTLMFLSLAAMLLVGCGGGAKTMQSAETGDIPDWYLNVPRDPNYLFAVNTATSQDLQLAFDKAITAARAEIGRQVEVKINALQKRFEEETGAGADAQILSSFTQATKTVVSTSLSGSRVSKQKQLRDGNMWRAYVLVEYPVGAANEALMQQIKQNERMYTKFRESQVFKELDEETKKYDEWKKQQNQ